MTASNFDLDVRVGGKRGERSLRRSAYFPRRYLTDFFAFLKHNKDAFEVLTYADLPWDGDCDYGRNYPTEWKNWKRQLASGERDPNKIYLVFQYDVDSRPDRTMALLREPSHQLAPANIMIFNRRVDRKRLKNSGELALTDYDLDIDLLQRLEAQSFVVGYHCNAYELSGFDETRALDIFNEDVRALSQHFKIRFFSAHGGVPDSRGRNNRHLPFHREWVDRLKWVHNGHKVRFDGHFSDGGHNSPRTSPLHRDLRSFVSRMRPGGRYGVLLHPQYYGEDPRISPRFGGTPWYDDLIRASRGSDGDSLWEDVELGQGKSTIGSTFADRFMARLRRSR